MRTALRTGLTLVAVVIALFIVLPDGDNGDGPDPAVPPPSAAARLTVLSDPAGAAVEVGIKAVDGVVTPGTGRLVGVTPITNLELTDADISYGPTSTNLYVEVRLDGYVPYLQTFGISESGLEPGKTYEIDVALSVP